MNRLVCVAALLLCAGASGCAEGNSGGGSSTTAAKKAAKYEGTDRSARIVTRQAYDVGVDGKNGDGNKLIRTVQCDRSQCLVGVRPEEATFNVEREYLMGARPLFKRLFALRSVRYVGVTFFAKITTAGGKEYVGSAASLVCDRSMHREINWDNVEPDGLKQICIWEPEVNLD